MSHATYSIYRNENEFVRGLVLQALMFADFYYMHFYNSEIYAMLTIKNIVIPSCTICKETYIKFMTQYINRNLYYRNLHDILFCRLH